MSATMADWMKHARNFWGGNGTENTPDVFCHDNCEQFFEQLSTIGT
jgi:hypothetical protein